MSNLIAEGGSPGAHLRQARELMGLSLADVAKALYLTAEHISMIEADDYSHTLGLTFERGYLRSYARLVKLPEDDIISAFNRLGLTEPAAIMPEGMYMKPITVKPRRVRWLTLGVGLLLLVLLAVWWQSNRTVVPKQMPLGTPHITLQEGTPGTETVVGEEFALSDIEPSDSQETS